ncbi:hypothetical protein [Dactylosporangium sp. NPDC051484]|uniref:hypothetical protein n=1 Tax=Dactylosporangium sp. NPDC051484 TaxID=3154942 RepID=UPI00344B6811
MSVTETQWLRTRRYLERNRFELGVAAAGDYGDDERFFGTPLLTRSSFVPPDPIPLDAIELTLDARPAARPTSREYGAVLPAGERYRNYSDAYRELAVPARVLDNRETYRLTSADLATAPARLGFGLGRYFDGIDTGEAAAHAFAARRRGEDPGRIRDRIADPRDLSARPVNMAVSALTLRRDASTGDAEFFLHWRDPEKVAHAGGLFQVVPSGVFQASGEDACNRDNDFSLARFLAREYAEELGGRAEAYDNDDRGIDYTAWPFARDFLAHLSGGAIRAWCVGLGVDPLTYATDLIAVLVFDAGVFDSLFGQVVTENDEGRVLAGRPFTEAEVARLVARERMQAAGAGLLAAAWHHRSFILA